MPDILQLDKELRANQFASVYLIYGPEQHLVSSAKRQIVKAIFRDQEGQPDIFWGDSLKMGTLLTTLQTPSLLHPTRVVLVEKCEEISKKDWEALSKVTKELPPKMICVLIADELTPGMVKLFSHAWTLECKKLYPRQIAEWLNAEAKNRGVAFSREGASFLSENLGQDLGILSQALETLILYVGAKKIIQIEDVERVISQSSQKNIFDLANAIGSKKRMEAIAMLNQMLTSGEEPLKILGMIARHLRLLAKAKALLPEKSGKVSPQFAKDLKVHPYFAQAYADQSRLWPDRWKNVFSLLAKTDRALKSQANTSQKILEKFLWELH